MPEKRVKFNGQLLVQKTLETYFGYYSNLFNGLKPSMVMVLKRNYHAKNTKFNEFLYLVILKLNGSSARQLNNSSQNYDFSQKKKLFIDFKTGPTILKIRLKPHD